MKKGLKILVLIGLFSSYTYAQEYSKNHEHDSSVIIDAPLSSAINEVYDSSKQVGIKSGKKTKNFLCSELHWQFFCKGD